MNRRTFLKFLAGVTGLFTLPWLAKASYPRQPAKITYSTWTQSKLDTFKPHISFGPMTNIPMSFEEECEQFKAIMDKHYPV